MQEWWGCMRVAYTLCAQAATHLLHKADCVGQEEQVALADLHSIFT